MGMGIGMGMGGAVQIRVKCMLLQGAAEGGYQGSGAAGQLENNLDSLHRMVGGGVGPTVLFSWQTLVAHSPPVAACPGGVLRERGGVSAHPPAGALRAEVRRSAVPQNVRQLPEGAGMRGERRHPSRQTTRTPPLPPKKPTKNPKNPKNPQKKSKTLKNPKFKKHPPLPLGTSDA